METKLNLTDFRTLMKTNGLIFQGHYGEPTFTLYFTNENYPLFDQIVENLHLLENVYTTIVDHTIVYDESLGIDEKYAEKVKTLEKINEMILNEKEKGCDGVFDLFKNKMTQIPYDWFNTKKVPLARKYIIIDCDCVCDRNTEMYKFFLSNYTDPCWE